MDGIIIINKSSGMTSFDVIARMRKILDMKKIGHAGTLDPDAKGVLPVCLGRATKVIEYLMGKDKAYLAVLRLGIETDSQDASGNTLSIRDVNVSDDEIETAIRSFVGSYMQIPPMYSAIRIGGKRLYELARQGLEIEREPRLVTIINVDGIRIIREGDAVRVIFGVTCSKGTYIRTLCSDIGKRLGCGGHMEDLTRTRTGPFLIESSVTLDELKACKENNTLDSIILGMDKALDAMPHFNVDDESKGKLKNGLKIPLDKNSGIADGLARVYDHKHQLLAIGKIIAENESFFLKSHKWLEV